MSHACTVLSADRALPGSDREIQVSPIHLVTGERIIPPFKADLELATFAMGCYWGAERRFWQQQGVSATAVGFIAGITPNPTYDETCTGLTGHTEAVRVIFDPNIISYESLLKVFWESHDPTQGMRQGNDVGTQYRSGIYADSDDQLQRAEASRVRYQQQLAKKGHGAITTEIMMAPTFYYAEDYHQQYLAKNPNGYCGLRGTGTELP